MRRRSESIRDKLLPAGAFLLLLLLWQGIAASGWVPGYMLPSPVDVIRAFIADFPNLAAHAWVSVEEALLGLLLGTLLAFGLACAMDRFLNLERAVLPLLVASQTIPTIAIAPLLVLWMDPDAVSLLRSMGATRRKIFRHVKWPAALPYFFAGLRISASYAVVGAVISEWLGGFEGLGVYMTRVRKAYAFDKMFAVIILVVIVSLLLMRLVTLLRAVSMPWLRKDPARVKALQQS